MFFTLPINDRSDRWRVRIAVALVTLLLGVCTFYHWRAPDPVQLAGLDSNVARVQEIERDILSDVSFMRVGDRRSTRIREHLEQLGRTVLELKRTMERDYPGVVARSEDQFTALYGRVEAEERAVANLVLHLEFLLERLYRIPETIHGLERVAPYIWSDPELTSVVGSILRDLFVSAARSDASSDQWFEEDLERLRKLRDVAAKDLAPVIERLTTYCESLAERAVYVDTGLAELEQLPVSQAVADLREACLVEFASQHELARRWRWTLALTLGLMITALSFRILVLGKSRQLDQSEVDLLNGQLGARDDLVEELELQLADERTRAERAEASHRRARLQEQAALRAKQESLSFLEHQVRGRARKLLAEVRESDTGGEGGQEVARHAQGLHDTLSDLFDMQLFQTNELEPDRADCDLDEILERVEAHGRRLARTKAISLSVHRAEGVPDQVHTDPERLRRALQNLLEHAILSTDTGEVELRVDLHSGAPDHLRFRLRDSGRGMNSDRIDFLFTPPQDGERLEGRAEALATPGLAIVPSLAKALGGSFHVDSVIGHGTTILLEVAIQEDPTGTLESGESEPMQRSRPEPRPVAVAPPTPKPKDPLVGRRILVAEDGTDNRRLMDFLLTRAGAQVRMVMNGEMAVEEVMDAASSGRPFDIVLMDMNMPVLDGYGATQELREKGYDRPIVALTASALPENRDRCMEAGCDEFMTKPVDAKVFAHQLEEIALERVGPAADPEWILDGENLDETGSSAGSDRGKDPDAESEDRMHAEDECRLVSEYAEDEDMAELIDLFVRDLRSDIRRINVALSDGDLESLGVLAHQLKGSAGSYGFPQLTAQADRLESCVRTGVDPDRLEQEVREFVGLCKRISG